MPVIVVKTPFRIAEDGNHVVDYVTGEHEVPERTAVVAVEHLQVATLKTKPKTVKGKANEPISDTGSGEAESEN
jgi:hypothetical protein